MSTSRSTPHFNDAVAAHFRAARELRFVSQDGVAAGMRALGFPWTRSMVGNYENGIRQVELPELLALLACASTSLAAAFDEIGEVEVSEEIHLRGDQILDVILGARGLAADEDPRWKRSVSVAEQIEREATGDAERAAAKSLGVEPTTIVEASRRLWGRTLSRERDARMRERLPGASASSERAFRGHVTRTLLDELAPRVEAMQRRRRKPATTKRKAKR